MFFSVLFLLYHHHSAGVRALLCLKTSAILTRMCHNRIRRWGWRWRWRWRQTDCGNFLHLHSINFYFSPSASLSRFFCLSFCCFCCWRANFLCLWLFLIAYSPRRCLAGVTPLRLRLRLWLWLWLWLGFSSVQFQFVCFFFCWLVSQLNCPLISSPRPLLSEVWFRDSEAVAKHFDLEKTLALAKGKASLRRGCWTRTAQLT